jgi:hypothetical protein
LSRHTHSICQTAGDANNLAQDFVLSVALTPGGDWVLSGSKDRGVQFWDPQTGDAQLMLQGHKNSGKLVNDTSTNSDLSTHTRTQSSPSPQDPSATSLPPAVATCVLGSGVTSLSATTNDVPPACSSALSFPLLSPPYPRAAARRASSHQSFRHPKASAHAHHPDARITGSSRAAHCVRAGTALRALVCGFPSSTLSSPSIHNSVSLVGECVERVNDVCGWASGWVGLVEASLLSWTSTSKKKSCRAPPTI